MSKRRSRPGGGKIWGIKQFVYFGDRKKISEERPVSIALLGETKNKEHNLR